MNIDPSGLASRCATWECAVYGGTDPSNINGPSLRDLNETTPTEVVNTLTAASIVTGAGALITGSIRLGTASILTGGVATSIDPTPGNIGSFGISLTTRGASSLINRRLIDIDQRLIDSADGINLLFQSYSVGSSLRCNRHKCL